MQGDTNTKGNPNETILIPLLHKRISDLTTETLLLQARLQWVEEEKKEMLGEIGSKTQRILDLEHAEAGKIDGAKTEVRGQFENEKAALLQSFQAERTAFQEEKNRIRAGIEDEKRIIAENWQREMATQTGHLRGQIESLMAQLNASNSKVSELQSVIAQWQSPDPVKPEPKRKGKKEATAMGGGTF